MNAGVSTACLYPMPVEESLYQLAVNGVSCVEIFVNTHSELERKFACNLADMLRRFDMRCASVHPFTCEIEPLMFFSEYERRMNDILEYYRLFFSFMNTVGADIFVFHGAKGAVPKELYCERYSKLYNLGQEYGIQVAVENVSRCRSSSSAFIRDISKMLGNNFAFVLDTKQAIRSGETPFSFIEAAGKSLKHIHISDSGEMGDCLPIGKGSFRFRQFFDKVNSVNPNTNIILELYRNNFRGISDLISGYNILTNMTKQYNNQGGAA
ncbi:MAG: sugar phosphate isomerase/epimerase [Ruminococcus sp.]|nr:sugar phosphate isomerase/epimerase [Ruminococcus sp.]